jgi:hypothetical protein
MIVEEASCSIVTYNYLLEYNSQESTICHGTLLSNTQNIRDAWTHGLDDWHHMPQLLRWKTQWHPRLSRKLSNRRPEFAAWKFTGLSLQLPLAVSMHFESMIELVGVYGIRNKSADRFNQVYIVELEAIGPVQL